MLSRACSLLRCRALLFRPHCHHLWRSNGTRRFAHGAADLGIAKEFGRDTILYKIDNLSQLRKYQLFAFINFIVWAYLGSFMFNYIGSVSLEAEKKEILAKDPAKKDTRGYNFWMAVSVAERKYHIHLAVICGIIGYGGAIVVGFFSTRSVNTIIVRKGGLHATILTSRALSVSKLRELTVPLSHISCKTHRENTPNYMTFKVKGHPFFFLVDTKGTFYNTYLFDRTFGMQRNLNKGSS